MKKKMEELKREIKKSNEYINSDEKDKAKVMEKINELIKKQKYIKEKQIIEQKLNKKEQELNKKEQELINNKIKINDLRLQNKLLNEELDHLKKSNDLKNKQNNKLRDEISKLKEVKIDKDLSTMPKIPQDVSKKDSKRA